MAVCKWCGQEMLDRQNVTDCTVHRTVLYPDGTVLLASTFHFNEPSGRCHDCGIVHGNYHHPGCDVERCPRCGGQLISCDCFGE